MTTPRLYSDLIDLWPLVSPPEGYVEEVGTFVSRFRRGGVPEGGRVLHMGSGAGSIDYHLKRSYRVTGIDLREAMVAHARRLNPEVDYRVGDIRTHRVGDGFDAVLVHDAISYMTTREELAAVYATAAAHLAPGGVLITLPEELRARVVADRNRVETHVDGDRTVTIVELHHDPDPADNTCEMLLLFVIRQNGDVSVELDRHVCGAFDIEDFVAAVEGAGFDAVVEPWELSDWQPDEVRLPLITAVRRG